MNYSKTKRIYSGSSCEVIWKVGAVSEHSLGGVLKQVDFKEFLRILEIEFGTEYRKLNPPSGGRYSLKTQKKDLKSRILNEQSKKIWDMGEYG